ncbi:MAG TPA: imidazole glycerol phosphate synthase subunit HisH [Longimicrobiaceae bacterium]|nr:imidazole glycerol phosphate synthase subunit HisH [Longimicrobiaceae bacterium]
MRVAILDYGTGNLHSLAKALERSGAQVSIETDPVTALSSDALILPGVGAFAEAAAGLAPCVASLREALIGGLPCLGICLGMQLLFEGSDEGAGAGIGLIPGHVRRLRARRVPHMGWNAVQAGSDPIFAGIEREHLYFANSFAAEPAERSGVVAWTDYDGDAFPAAVRHGRTWGVQFHPEKSGAAGLRLLENFLGEVA